MLIPHFTICSDPKDTQFIGTFKVHDGQELILGIFMSCSAILWSEHIYDRLQGTRFLSVDWSSLSCNALSCFLLYGTYTAKIYFPDLIEHNLLMLKFVSSFCGSLSCLSACITHMSVRGLYPISEIVNTHRDSLAGVVDGRKVFDRCAQFCVTDMRSLCVHQPTLKPQLGEC